MMSHFCDNSAAPPRLLTLDPTLDPNAPARAGTGQDEISSSSRLAHCEYTLFVTRCDALTRPPSNFETAPFDRSGTSPLDTTRT